MHHAPTLGMALDSVAHVKGLNFELSSQVNAGNAGNLCKTEMTVQDKT